MSGALPGTNGRAGVSTSDPARENPSMSLKDSTVNQSDGTDRRIDPERIERALTDDMTVREHARQQYLVARDGDDHEEHLVDVEAGTCDGEDAHFRDVVCVHMVRASLHHLFAHGADTWLVARVAGAIADLGCPHGNDCDGPCEAGQYPCPACVRSTNTGDWTVYQRLVAREPAAAVDRGEGVCTDGGEDTEGDAADESDLPAIESVGEYRARCTGCGRVGSLDCDGEAKIHHSHECPRNAFFGDGGQEANR